MSEEPKQTRQVRVDPRIYSVLVQLTSEYMTEANRPLTLGDTVRLVLEDARPDLMGIEPPLRFRTLTMPTRERLRRVWLDLMATEHDLLSLDDVINHLIAKARPDLIDPSEDTQEGSS